MLFLTQALSSVSKFTTPLLWTFYCIGALKFKQPLKVIKEGIWKKNQYLSLAFGQNCSYRKHYLEFEIFANAFLENTLYRWIIKFVMNLFTRGLILDISWRYTNGNLKISLYFRVHRKTLPWKFRILNPWEFSSNFSVDFVFFKKYSGTSLKWTSSKADTSLRRAKNFVPDEFLKNPL